MDRLTHFIAKINGTRRYDSVNFQGQKGGNKQDFINALGLYEDTRLSPIEVAALAKAKSFDKLVILPCRVGEKAFLLLEKLNGTKPDIIETICIKYYQQLFCNKVSERWSFYFDCHDIGNSLEFKREDFGKGIFLSKTEAQAELYRLESRINA